MRKLSIVGLLMISVPTAGVLTTVPAAASASCAPVGSAFASDAAATAGLNCPGDQADQESTKPKKRTSGKVVKPACVWVAEPDYLPRPGQQAGGSGGQWYRKFCSFGDYQTLADFEQEMSGWDAMNMRQSNMLRRAGLETRWFATPPSPPRRTPDQVMASVVDSLPFPKTFIAVNPATTKQVVGVPTWAWLTDEKGQFVPSRYQPDEKTIVLEGYPLRLQIVPQLTVTPGDGGAAQSCEGFGVPWSAKSNGDPGACTATYERSGRYTLTANVAWTVQWWLDGARQDDITGPTNSATRAVTVLEVQALGR